MTAFEDLVVGGNNRVVGFIALCERKDNKWNFWLGPETSS